MKTAAGVARVVIREGMGRRFLVRFAVLVLFLGHRVSEAAPTQTQLIQSLIPCSSDDECRDWAHEGTYVDLRSKEINIALHFLSEHGTRASEIAEYIRSKVDALAETPSAFSFLPKKLGTIVGFEVRVHIEAFSEGDAPPRLASAAFGASAIVIVTTNDPAAQQSIVDRVIASPGYYENTPIMLVVEDENPSRVALAPKPPVSLIIATKPGNRSDFFASLKAAAKLAIYQLKDPKATAAQDALVPVALVPLVELLRAEEKRKGRALTKQEVIDVRDQATFIALTPARAASIAQKRGRDVDASDPWRDWEARRKK